MNCTGGTLKDKRMNLSLSRTAGVVEEYTFENPFTKERVTEKMASGMYRTIICSQCNLNESMVKIEENVEGPNTVHVLRPGIIRANISVASDNGPLLYRRKLFYKSRPPYTWFTVADVIRVIETQIPRGMIKSLYYDGERLVDHDQYLCSLPYEDEDEYSYNGWPIVTLDFTIYLKKAIFYSAGPRIVFEEYDPSMTIHNVREYFAKMHPGAPLQLIDVALNGQIISHDDDDKTVSEVGYSLGDLFSCEIRRNPETTIAVNFKRVDHGYENQPVKLDYEFTIVDQISVARKKVAQCLSVPAQSVCLFYAGKNLHDNIIISRLAMKDSDFVGVYVKSRDVVPLMSESRLKVTYDIKFKNTTTEELVIIRCHLMMTIKEAKTEILTRENHPQHQISMQFDDRALNDDELVVDFAEEDSAPILFTITKPDSAIKKVKSRRCLLESTVSSENFQAQEEEEDEDAISEREEKLYAEIPWQELIVLRKNIPHVDEIEAIEKYIELGKNCKAVIAFFKKNGVK